MPEISRKGQGEEEIGLIGAASIGVGGMIGAGIFSILGVVGQGAGSFAWGSFLGAGLIALVCSYSFAKLGAAFPASGGPVEYLLRGLGNTLLSGSLNIMLWLGYILAIALYTSAFASYGVALLSRVGVDSAWLHPVLAVAVVGLFLLINIMGAGTVGRAQGWIVGIMLLILLGFVATIAFSVQPELLGPEHWESTPSIVTSVGVVFVAYVGFGLINNAAGDMRNPNRTLPRAMALAVVLTIIVYVAVTAAAFGNLSSEEIIEASEYALAASAEPSLGQVGFTVMGIVALFTTASSINATLFGSANVSIQAAQEGQLPAVFSRPLIRRTHGGLYITAALVALLGASVPLDKIANTASAAFLLIYAGVCWAHLRLLDQTGAKEWLVWLGLIGCVGVFLLLAVYLARNDITSAIGLGGLIGLSVGSEWVYRRIRGATPARPKIDQRHA